MLGCYEEPKMDVVRLEESLKVVCLESGGPDTDEGYIDVPLNQYP